MYRFLKKIWVRILKYYKLKLIKLKYSLRKAILEEKVDD